MSTSSFRYTQWVKEQPAIVLSTPIVPTELHLSWLEVGTSDFDTFCQSEKVADGAMGMSVEPLSYYLDRLPVRKDVVKVQAALSNVDGEQTIHHTPDDQIKKHNLPDWVRGCNSLGRAHPTVAKLIDSMPVDKRPSILSETVSTMSYGTLMTRYNVKSVGCMKIDTEGHDLVILGSVMEWCSTHPACWPRSIKFESNDLHDQTKVTETVEALKRCGYLLLNRGYDTVMVRS